MVRYLRHLHAGRWLSAYADGEAPVRRRRSVRRHVAECPDCASVLEFILASKQALGRAGQGGSRPRRAVHEAMHG